MTLDFNNQKWVFRPKRLKYFRKFIDKTKGDILVFGMGEFEKHLAPEANLIPVSGDYNYPFWIKNVKGYYDTIYCFEVIEHLLNPHSFLLLAKSLLTVDGSLYISHPTGRPVWLWTNGHFHEYQMKRAIKMFEMVGLRVIKQAKTGAAHKKFWEYFKGIRPLIRLFIPLRFAIYELKKG